MTPVLYLLRSCDSLRISSYKNVDEHLTMPKLRNNTQPSVRQYAARVYHVDVYGRWSADPVVYYVYSLMSSSLTADGVSTPTSVNINVIYSGGV